jgi:hypothetical protein
MPIAHHMKGRGLMKYRRLLYAGILALILPMAAQAAVSVFVNIAPPLLPVYVQPPISAPGYIWTPGYWAWDPIVGDYYWVPGTWVAPPVIGLLWTPGYWGWGSGGYFWHGGYWGHRVGFYGGVNYGYGYTGSGYHGGYWRGGVFNYNRSVNNINTTTVRNVYNERVVESHHERVSFSGGQGGIAARESAQERAARAEHHYAPTPVQHQHEQVAMRAPEQRASFNHGAPTLAAMPRPSFEHSAGIPRPPTRMEAQRVERGVPPPPRMEAQRVERAGPPPGRPQQPAHVERGGPPHEGGGRGEPRGGPGQERER